MFDRETESAGPLKTKKRRLPRWWWIGGLIGFAVGIGPLIHGVDEAANANDPKKQATEIEAQVLAKNPALALVARHETAMWRDEHRRLVALLRDHPQGIQGIVSAEIMNWQAPMNNQLKKGAARAGDPAAIAIYRAKLALLQNLQASSVDACKSYVDLDVKSLARLPDALKAQIRTADNPLYSAYEEGVDKPAPAVLTEAQADATLVRMRGTTGVRLSNRDMDLIGGMGGAPEVCDAMVRFMKVIVQAPASESAQLIRFMLSQ